MSKENKTPINREISALNIADVSDAVCVKCGCKTSVVQHPSKLCYNCWKAKQTER